MCLTAHKATERCLKALFICLEEDPDRTRNLLDLSEKLKKFVELPDYIIEYLKILNQYIDANYPSDDIFVDKKSYLQAINAAEESLKWVVSKIEQLTKEQEVA